MFNQEDYLSKLKINEETLEQRAIEDVDFNIESIYGKPASDLRQNPDLCGEIDYLEREALQFLQAELEKDRRSLLKHVWTVQGNRSDVKQRLGALNTKQFEV
jgi:hypothetical protein